MDTKNPSATELLDLLDLKLAQGHYKDSVHQIKLMTAREVIQKILDTEFKR